MQYQSESIHTISPESILFRPKFRAWTNIGYDAMFGEISSAILYDVIGSIKEIQNHSKSWKKGLTFHIPYRHVNGRLLTRGSHRLHVAEETSTHVGVFMDLFIMINVCMVIAFCSYRIYLSNAQRTTIVFVYGSHDFLLNTNEEFMFVASFRVSIFDYIRAFAYVVNILPMFSVALGPALLHLVH